MGKPPLNRIIHEYIDRTNYKKELMSGDLFQKLITEIKETPCKDKTGYYLENSREILSQKNLEQLNKEKISPESYGICGGTCSCGTCHVYVDPNDFKKLKNLEEDEIEILKKFADKPNANSRLACQVELKKEYSDMTVTIAKESVDNLSEL